MSAPARATGELEDGVVVGNAAHVYRNVRDYFRDYGRDYVYYHYH